MSATAASFASDVTWICHHSIVAGLVKQPAHLLGRELSTRKQAKPFEPLWQLLVDVLLKRRIVCRLSPRTEGVWGRREESGPDWAYLLLEQGTLLQSGSLKGDSEPQLCGHRRLYFLWQNRGSWRQYTLASLSPLFSFLSGFLHSLSPPQSQPHFPKPSQTQSRNNLFHAYILAFWGLGVFLQWNAKYYSLLRQKLLCIALCSGQHVGSKFSVNFPDRSLLVPVDSSRWPHPC